MGHHFAGRTPSPNAFAKTGFQCEFDFGRKCRAGCSKGAEGQKSQTQAAKHFYQKFRRAPPSHDWQAVQVQEEELLPAIQFQRAFPRVSKVPMPLV